MKKVKELLFRLIEVVLHILKVNRNMVFFSSFRGQYNDNPKYISIKLHELHPEISQYWVISDKSKMNDIPDYVNIVQYNTFAYCVKKNRCIVLVENGAGSYIFNSSKVLKTIKSHLKNNKQLDLSTWHGNPIKHIGAQIPGNENWTRDTLFTTSDVLMSGCKQIKDVFEEAFLGMIPVKLTGTPRNDILFCDDQNLQKEYKKKLGLPDSKKVILYAPTYRYSAEDSGIVQMNNIDFDCLFHTLHQKFGGDWVFVFRVHNMVIKAINTQKITDSLDERIINGNEYDDMAEYLFACDILLTDYSGCIYDVSLTNKPCFLYAHDRKHYIEKERGLYMPLEEFPYSFSDSFTDLVHNISQYDYNQQEEKRQLFLQKIGNVEDGKASLRAVKMIERYIDSEKQM